MSKEILVVKEEGAEDSSGGRLPDEGYGDVHLFNPFLAQHLLRETGGQPPTLFGKIVNVALRIFKTT